MGGPCYFYQTQAYAPSELAKKMWFYVHGVGWFRCSPTFEVFRKSYLDYLLAYVVRGKGYVAVSGRVHEAREKQLFFINLNHEHRYYAAPNDPWEIRWIHFGGDQCQDYIRLLESEENPVMDAPHAEQFDSIFRRVHELFTDPPAGVEARASSLINWMLTDMVSAKLEGGDLPDVSFDTVYPDTIRQSISYIEQNYANPLKLEEIAARASLSPFHFARMFKRATGVSVMEYLLRFRITQAKHLLAQTDLSVREISEMVGFTDQSYFSKVFKRYENKTPKGYRTLKQLPGHQEPP